MKKNNIYILIILGIFTLFSCSKFEQINKNPNDPTDIKSELLLNNILYSTFADDGAGRYGLYSSFAMSLGGEFVQHFSQTQYNTVERYFASGSADFLWSSLYINSAIEAQSMYNLALKEENTNAQAIALTLKAYIFQVLTDCFGDIPFSEALKASEGIFTPKYDAQEDVYAGINDMLKEADNLFSMNIGEISSTNDIMYQGDISKWRKLCNSLRFKVLMRVSGKVSDKIGNIPAQLNQIVTSGNIFSSNDDEAKFILSTNPAANPYYENIGLGNTQGYCVNQTFVNALVLRNDSLRLNVYATKLDDGSWKGKPSGYQIVPPEYLTVSQIGTHFTNVDAPIYIMSFSQLQFLLAEAKQKGLISVGDAETYYYSGIEASYLSLGLTSSQFSEYKALGRYPFTSANAIEQIAFQEWVTLFGQGIEAWIENKRTKIPVLSMPIDNNPQVTSIPVRYIYPTEEQTNNSANYNAAVSRQGADLLTTNFWWLKP